MNGELDQLCRLVLYVKDIIRSGRVVDFKPGRYEKRLFFIPKKNSLFSKVEECNDAQSWYKLLEKREIKDIHLVSYFEEDNIKFAGFSNSTEQGIVTEYANGKTTIWIAKWEFDEERKGWTSYYKEFKWRGGSQYTYEECRRDFERTLLDIEELARLLGFDNFAKIFKEAYDILTSKGDSSIPEWARDDMPNLTEERLRLFLAASEADVFGAMGSWNDNPEVEAREKGLQEKYNNLSHDLYVSTRKAVMNAVNG